MDVLNSLLKEFPPPTKHVNYGTAGFRDNWELLRNVFIRVGVLSFIRSAGTSDSDGVKCVGVMITASHNPVDDNGVKIVDADGGMMTQSWEKYAESLANCKSIEDLHVDLLTILRDSIGKSSVVIVGRDTRPHSKELSDLVVHGASVFNAKVLDIGEVTTPQLHYVVQRLNIKYDANATTITDALECLNDYYRITISSFLKLSKTSAYDIECANKVVVDVAGGIGDYAVNNTNQTLINLSESSIRFEIRNHIGSVQVNEKCGAEYVQKNQLPPTTFVELFDRDRLLCSFDGDADRIVFHAYLDLEKTGAYSWVLFDGDKIASILSLFLIQELTAASLLSELTMSVVQTAYANGSSTKFLRSNNIHVSIAKTGVKYLHHKALEYDIGVYFEANGHGTVLFSSRFYDQLEMLTNRVEILDDNDRLKIAAVRLKAFSTTINSAVGDALSDMLCVLACMKILNTDILSWHRLYTDLPSRQIKVPVKNKNSITCSDDETIVLSPAIIQEELNVAMNEAPSGRAFIRPSGTEDVVRIYAEAATQYDADKLAKRAIEIVNNYLG